jgi:hypothetical protein
MPAVKRIELVAPSQRNKNNLVVCCKWAMFEVKEYAAEASASDKMQVNWEFRDSQTCATLKNPGTNESGVLLINQIPDDWEGKKIDVFAYTKDPQREACLSFSVQTCGVPETPKSAHLKVGIFINLVKKIETIHSDWSLTQVLSSLRKLCTWGHDVAPGTLETNMPNYDSAEFRQLLGFPEDAGALSAQIGGMTSSEIDLLRKMVAHEISIDPKFGTKKELGVVFDAFGKRVAIGHVIVGIAAGQWRQRKFCFEQAKDKAMFGEYMDNLYAATIAGDLGQSACAAYDACEGQIGRVRQTLLIGGDSEASGAELVGDIDGFLLGEKIEGMIANKRIEDFETVYYKKKSTSNQFERDNTFKRPQLANSSYSPVLNVKLSELLHDYYCVFERKKHSQTAGDRFFRFNTKADKKTLRVQAHKFAVNYGYKKVAGAKDLREKYNKGVSAAFKFPVDFVHVAVEDFLAWLQREVAQETGIDKSK